MSDTNGKDLPNWETFENEVAALRSQFAQSPSRLLFRGQSDADFRLTTTLERAGCDRIPIKDYYRLVVGRVKPAAETFLRAECPALQFGAWGFCPSYILSE